MDANEPLYKQESIGKSVPIPYRDDMRSYGHQNNPVCYPVRHPTLYRSKAGIFSFIVSIIALCTPILMMVLRKLDFLGQENYTDIGAALSDAFGLIFICGLISFIALIIAICVYVRDCRCLYERKLTFAALIVSIISAVIWVIPGLMMLIFLLSNLLS